MRGSTDRLAQLVKPIFKTIHPPEAIHRMKRAEAALADDGSLSDFAANSSLGHQVATWYISGGLSVGNQQGMVYRVPCDGELERLDCNAKTAPTGADLLVQLRQNNTVLVTCTITDSDEDGGLPILLPVNAGDQLTIDITQVGSSVPGSNLTASVTFREER